jgi:hypothetical protein
MATEEERNGMKVEELTPQPLAYSTTARGTPRRSLLQKEGSSNVSYRGIERKPLKYLRVGFDNNVVVVVGVVVVGGGGGGGGGGHTQDVRLKIAIVRL